MSQIEQKSPTATEEVNKVKNAIESVDIEKVYFNGFSCSLAPGDVLLTLFRNGQPVKVLNTSYTVAKSFGEKLIKLVQVLESATQQKIMTTDFINQKLGELKNDPKSNVVK